VCVTHTNTRTCICVCDTVQVCVRAGLCVRVRAGEYKLAYLLLYVCVSVCLSHIHAWILSHVDACIRFVSSSFKQILKDFHWLM